VAGGLGDYFNVDPAIFRLAFVVLTFFGGSGFMLYVLGWLMLPERNSGASVGEDLVRRAGGGRSVALWIAIAIVGLVVIENSPFFDSGLLWAVLLIAAGVFFFRRDEASQPAVAADQRPGATAAAAAPTPPPPSPPPAPQPPVRPESALPDPKIDPLFNDPRIPDESAIFGDDWRPTPVPEPPEPPPPPSVLGRITVAAALILGGLLALAHNLTSLSVDVDQYAALGVAVVGAGLIVGARLGRSHGLIPLGIFLVLVMAGASSLGGLTLPEETGVQRWAPRTVAALRDSYELDVGNLQLDLTELQLERGQRVAVNAEVGAGQLLVDVPPGVTVDLDASSSAGNVEAFGRTADGPDASIEHVQRGPEGSPTIELDLDVGLGRIEVDQASETVRPSEVPPQLREPASPAQPKQLEGGI
jgi:phage shock protein PspC (stress-responsive transcriptional regulator)